MTDETMTVEQLAQEAKVILGAVHDIAGLGLQVSLTLASLSERDMNLSIETCSAFLDHLLALIASGEGRLQVLRDEYQARRGEVMDLEQILEQS